MIEITKQTGEKETFSKKKFCDSLKKAGAPKDIVSHVCEQVSSELHPGMTSSDIFRKASSYLLKQNPAAAARYSIKRGVAELGPAGFLFEQYVEVILRTLGYKTRRNVIMRGECVPHEVDVLAKNDKEHVIVEAKYHNETRIKTPVDVVMYADARLQDIARRQKRVEGKYIPHVMWVFTNTRFSSHAVKYAKCRGLRLTGWSYPKGSSLENIIEQHMLYPVTTLPSVDRFSREQFAKHNMMLAQDLAPYDADEIAKKFGINKKRAEDIAREVKALVYGE